MNFKSKFNTLTFFCILFNFLTIKNSQAQTPEVTRYLERWAILNVWCRGETSEDAIVLKACDLREAVGDWLEKANWCYGKEGDYGYQMKWHICQANSNRSVPLPGSPQHKRSLIPTLLGFKVTDTLMDGGIKEIDLELAEKGLKRTIRGVLVNCGKTGIPQVVVGNRQWSINSDNVSIMSGPKGFPASEVWKAVCR